MNSHVPNELTNWNVKNILLKSSATLFAISIISSFYLSYRIVYPSDSELIGTFENSFKLSILTLTNTVTSALYGMDNLSFFDLNNFTKVSLMVFMIFGKIEIIAVLFLIKKYIFKE